MPVEHDVTGPAGALTRGLEVLRLVAESRGPVTASELARRIGVHQSSVSRILATLIDAGYVRKAGPRAFVPDFGILALGCASHPTFELMSRTREAIERAAGRAGRLEVSLGMLWRGRTIYFLRALAGSELGLFSGTGYPLHLSSVGLRCLIELPDDEAIAMLTASRERFGWPRGTDRVPETERATLAAARALLSHDVLILADWESRGHVTAAIRLHTDEPYPVALALSGPTEAADADTLRLMLHEAGRDVEAALRGAGRP